MYVKFGQIDSGPVDIFFTFISITLELLLLSTSEFHIHVHLYTNFKLQVFLIIPYLVAVFVSLAMSPRSAQVLWSYIFLIMSIVITLFALEASYLTERCT